MINDCAQRSKRDDSFNPAFEAQRIWVRAATAKAMVEGSGNQEQTQEERWEGVLSKIGYCAHDGEE